jgi:hypothetical protein
LTVTFRASVAACLTAGGVAGEGTCPEPGRVRNAAAEKAWSRRELMGKFMEPRVSVSSEDRRA